MNNLCITVTFLDRYYHGHGDLGPEWPPSPWRLYQSLLATAASNNQDSLEVFQWFESLETPQIMAPKTETGVKRKTYVPDNASDVKLERQERLSEKIVHPVIIKGKNRTLHYLWSIDKADRDYADQIAAYAKKLISLGWGIDLVAGNGKILGDAEIKDLIAGYHGICYVPRKNIGKSYRCPTKGSYSNLKMVHETKLNRFDGTVYTPPKRATVFDEVGYREKGIIPIRRVACFKLLHPSDEVERWARFDPRDTVRVSSWVRGYLCDIAKKDWDYKEDSGVYVAGHHKEGQKKTPPRFSYLPLPTIGHPQADGLIRRLIVAEPFDDDGEKAGWAGRILNSVTLKNDSGLDVARIEQIKTDPVIEKYCDSSYRFKTVTPVILPGHDSRKYSKADKLFLKAVSQAGFDVEDIDHYILQKAPYFNGAYHPNDYRKVKHLERFTSLHVLIKWKKKIRGPLAIGAGRHRGLGLFVPDNEE